MSEDLARIIARIQRQRRSAAKKMIPWTTAKPRRRGVVWLGAKWQKAGFYHLQIYTFKSVAYLRKQNDEFWSGPYPMAERWHHFVPQPNPESINRA